MREKNILVICKDIPYPPHRNGVSSTLYNLIDQWINLKYNVSILYLSKKEIENEKVLQKKGVIIKNQDICKNEIICGVQENKLIKPRNSWGSSSKLFTEIDATGYDYIIYGSLITTIVFDKIHKKKQSKIIFFEADSLSMYYERSMNYTKNFIKKIYFYTQKQIAKIMYQIFDKTIFVSDVDRRYARKYCEKGKMETIKIGVAPYEGERIKGDNSICNIAFSGIMDYEPNIQAVNYIIEYILPLLDKIHLKYKVHIIGKNPRTEWLKNRYCFEGKLVVTGYVEDIESYIAGMDIYISPLFLGSGMKNKILQAMSIGIPIIASEISVDGINELQDKENYLLCDDKAESWINAIRVLYSNRKMCDDFSDKCKSIIHNNYSWNNVALKIIEE